MKLFSQRLHSSSSDFEYLQALLPGFSNLGLSILQSYAITTEKKILPVAERLEFINAIYWYIYTYVSVYIIKVKS